MEHVASSPNPSAKRRSTRVAEAVYFKVSGIDAGGQPFVEETGTVHLSLHGCSYFSKHTGAKNSWLSLEIPNQQSGAPPHKIRARVVWNRKSRNLPGLSQVGVEFDGPADCWGLASPPPDWNKEPDWNKKEDVNRIEDGRQKQAHAQTTIAGEFNVAVFQSEMKELLAIADRGNYYQLLHVTSDSPRSDIKHNYYEFVRKCHPDRHMDHPEWMERLEKLMHAVTLAYKTLTDEAARTDYDHRLAASGTFALSRNKTELQQTIEAYVEAGRKCFRAKDYGGSILWLRKAIEIEPESSTYHTLLAKSLAAVPVYRRQALEHLQKAIALDSLNLAAHSQIAELYEEMKLLWRSRPHYEKVLEIDSENSIARERLRLLDDAEEKAHPRKRTLTDHIFGRPAK